MTRFLIASLVYSAALRSQVLYADLKLDSYMRWVHSEFSIRLPVVFVRLPQPKPDWWQLFPVHWL